MRWWQSFGLVGRRFKIRFHHKFIIYAALVDVKSYEIRRPLPGAEVWRLPYHSRSGFDDSSFVIIQDPSQNVPRGASKRDINRTKLK
ncbi:hypothetical protein AVEN_239779-1 [Araneus ventricosus]|uniref:Uncharacterized protein n=1 Tax=Araneus ventricosus TaxID=182803 RepID=A0A4Y2ET58_ARAVE|nr:hypothetical protein AVEN_239779-1 [Araneus ventricosus]